MKKEIIVTEHVILTKIVSVEYEPKFPDAENYYNEAVNKALDDIPNYNVGGWDLSASEGCDVKWANAKDTKLI